MDYEGMKFWFDVAQFAATCLLGLYVWYSNRAQQTDSRISTLAAQVEEDLRGHRDRITVLEQEMKAIPTHTDLARLQDLVRELSTKVNTLVGRTEGLSHGVNILTEHLMGSGK